MTKRIMTAMVAAVVTMMMATTAFAGPCRDRHHGQRGHSCPIVVRETVVFMESESSKIRLVRVEEAVDAQNVVINQVVGAHNALVTKVEAVEIGSVERDAVLRADLDREVRERQEVDAETADLLLEGVDADESIEARAAEAEAAAAEARAKAIRLERELEALKEKK